jgi:hypothetical protein
VHVFGVQPPVGGVPHWFCTPPPPQVVPAGQGQVIVEPHPSLCTPQVPAG